jgi:anti-sigma28 factor (negative regulator of flagellin synthesis)
LADFGRSNNHGHSNQLTAQKFKGGSMSDSSDVKDKPCACPAASAVEGIKKRVRGLTSMSLDWLAERFRKAEKIKQTIESGTYRVDSDKLAQAIVNDESKNRPS